MRGSSLCWCAASGRTRAARACPACGNKLALLFVKVSPQRDCLGRQNLVGVLRRPCARAVRSCGRLREWPYIFMRWKERFFVNVGEDCGAPLTLTPRNPNPNPAPLGNHAWRSCMHCRPASCQTPSVPALGGPARRGAQRAGSARAAHQPSASALRPRLRAPPRRPGGRRLSQAWRGVSGMTIAGFLRPDGVAQA